MPAATTSSGMDNVARARDALRTADALLITAGAGMGVDSGLPDFRGRQGFWRAYPAIARLGLSFEQMAHPRWFEESPELAWAFYGHRLNLYRQVEPHAGFGRLLAACPRLRLGAFVFTSNVDGHFQKAGFPQDRIVECHGSIHHFQCTSRCCDAIWPADEEIIRIDEEEFRALPPLPLCPRCRALARPNVLMFGDGNWLSERTDAQHARFASWVENVCAASAKLVVIECGAGTAIPTVRATSEAITARAGGLLVRINPREAQVPPGHLTLPMGAADGLAAIC